MVFVILLAGVTIEIHSLHNTTKEIFDEYLLQSDYCESPDIKIHINDKDIINEWKKTKRSNNKQYVVYGEKYYEQFAVHRLICNKVVDYDTVLMHGAVVAYQGLGYMFTAPSGVGKTTRANIWLKEYSGSYIVNGDKPLIHVYNDKIVAYGTPWCGKEHFGKNTSIPLHAIYIIERVDYNEEETIKRLDTNHAFFFFFYQLYSSDDINIRKKSLSILKTITKRVKIYLLRSKPTDHAIRLAYSASQGDLAKSNDI